MRITPVTTLRPPIVDPVRKVQNVARNTQDIKEQLRIANNSTEHSVLMALALNKSLDNSAVQSLFKRNHKGVSKRLEALGFKEEWF